LKNETPNHMERCERAEHIADTLALVSFVICCSLGAIPGLLLFGAPGMVAGGVIFAPLSFVTGALVNKLPFMHDVY